jgi:hypothetical protein
LAFQAPVPYSEPHDASGRFQLPLCGHDRGKSAGITGCAMMMNFMAALLA